MYFLYKQLFRYTASKFGKAKTVKNKKPLEPLEGMFSKELNYILPWYDEFSVFIMAISVIPLLYYAYDDLKNLHDLDLRVIFIIVFYFFSMLSSVIQAFSKKKKNSFEKFTLLFFGFITQLTVGYFGSMHALNNSSGAFRIFPIINLCYCALLLIMFRFNIIDEKRVSDEDVSRGEIFVGVISAAILFMISRFLLNHNWAITFSMIMFYAVNARKAFVVVYNIYKGRAKVK